MTRETDRGMIFAWLAALLVLVSPCFGQAPEAVPLPDGQMTLMGRGGDTMFEGTIDFLTPLHMTPSGVLFVNPRFTYNDDSESELNLGVGYRHLFAPSSVIVGGNLYYDSRWPQDGVQFNQFGVGLEVMSKWVDARCNYYLPEDSTKIVDVREQTTLVGTTVTKTYDQQASGYTLYETLHTTTKDEFLHETFTTIVGTMEGFDAELGFRLPIFTDKLEARLFGGYYRFSPNLDLDDVEGFKARIEIRALPGLILDAEYYDDDKLFGSSYMVGGRVQLPFDVVDLVHGRNPFKGTKSVMMPGVRSFAQRLTENVVRDPHIQVCKKTDETSEIVENSVTTDTTYAMMRYTIFVDGDNNTGFEDGTLRHPFNTIQEGVDAAKARGFRHVYVFQASKSYVENVVIDSDLDIIGEGQRLGTDGGFGGYHFPVVDGSSGSSAALNINGAGSVIIRGFDVMNTGAGFGPVDEVVPDSDPVLSIPAGVLSFNTTSIQFSGNRVHDTPAGFLAVYGEVTPTMLPDPVEAFNIDVRQNSFRNTGLAVGVLSVGAGGTVKIQHNTIDNSLAGVALVGIGNTTDFTVTPAVSVINGTIHGNTINGGSVRLDQMITGSLLDGALDLFSVTLPPDHPAMVVPSIAGILAVGVPGVEMNLSIDQNKVYDNLLGIGVGSFYGRMTVDIANNTVRGGGLAQVVDLVNAHELLPPDILPEHLAFDGGLIGVGTVAYGVSDGVDSLMTVNISGNRIERNAIGAGVLEIGGATMNCVVDRNTISDNLVGVVGAGVGDVLTFKGIEEIGTPRLNLTVSRNTITGGGGEDLVALLDGQREPVGQYGALGVGVLSAGNGMNVSAVIEGNTIRNHLLGVAAGAVDGADISSLTIEGNSITGAGMNDVMGSAFDIPAQAADFGAIGIGLAAVDGDILDTHITGNTVNGHVIGIGAIVADPIAARIEAEISGNVLNNNSMGIGAICFGSAGVLSLDINGNTLNGGGPDLSGPLGGMLPFDFGVGAGVVCAATDGGNVTANIAGNTIRNSSGIGVYASSGTNSSLSMTLAGNSISGHDLFGVVLESDENGFLTADFDGNTIVDNNQSGLLPGGVSSSFLGLVWEESFMTMSLNGNVSDGSYLIGYDPAPPARFIGVASDNTLEDLVTPANFTTMPTASLPPSVLSW